MSLFLAGSAYALINVSSCGSLNSNSDYALTADIINYPSSSDCFVADHQESISFDCQGHIVDGTDANNMASGFKLLFSSNVTIRNCTVTDFGRGIWLDSSSNNSLYSITANSNLDYGIKLFPRSSNNVLSGITANSNWNGIGIYNSFDGSTASGSNNNTFSDITVSGNSGSGIYSYYSMDNTFSNIQASSNPNGIYLESSPANSFSVATLTSNSNLGMGMSNSQNNYFANVENELGFVGINPFYSDSAQNISSRLNTGWWPLLSSDGSAATSPANTAWYNGTSGGRNADGSANSSLHYWYNNQN